MPTTSLLLAEDDTLLADALTGQLRRAGFEVEHAPNGPVAEYLLTRQNFDVAILDIGLPMVDGLTVLQRVREQGRTLPVLILTALDGLADRVAGLNAGADDYLSKPFDFPELEARLHALLRRLRHGVTGAELGRLVFDRAAHRVLVGGAPLELSPREWLLLELLLTHRDRVVTKDQIVEAWAPDRNGAASSPGSAGAGGSTEGGEAGSGSIEVYIHRLRRKLEQSGVSIRTVRGLGYLLEAEAKS